MSEIVEDALRLIAGSFSEVVPSEAQLHLLNAQRELLLALAAIIEHNASRTVRHPRTTKKTTSKRKPARPSRVTID